MFKRLVIALLFLGSVQSWAAPYNYDSLWAVTQHDTTSWETKLDIGPKLVERYYARDADSANWLLVDLESQAMELGDYNGLAKLYMKAGGAHHNPDIVQRYELINKGIYIYENLNDTMGKAMGYRAHLTLYFQLSDSLKFYAAMPKAEDAILATENNQQIVAYYHATAYHLYNLRNPALAKEQLIKGYEFCMATPDSNYYTNVTMWFGNVYRSLGDYDSSHYWFDKYLKYGKDHQLTKSIAEAHRYRSFIYFLQEDYETANIYLDSSFYFFSKANQVDRTGLILTYKAVNLKEMGRYQEAAKLLDRIYREHIPLSQPSIDLLTHEEAPEIYAKAGRYQDAYEKYLLYIQVGDSLDLQSKAAQLDNFQLEDELNSLNEKAEKERQLSALENEKAQLEKDAAVRTRNAILIGSLAGIIGLGIVIVLIVRNLRQKKQANAEILHQKELIEVAHEEIQDSIAYAKRIQQAILPPNKLVKEQLKNSFILYKPKDVVAGDFYWMDVQDNGLYIAAADCTGHGVPGAMVSVICNGALNRSVNEFGIKEPGQILDKTRELVIQEFEKSEEEVKDGMDIALCCLTAAQGESQSESASDSPSHHTLQYSGAHNPLWIIRKGSEEVEQIKADKQPIGKYADESPFTTHSVELNAGDTFYLFSDGYADQFGGDKGKKFKAANFKRLLLSIKEESMDRQMELIDQKFEEWRGSLEQVDDVCVIGVRV